MKGFPKFVANGTYQKQLPKDKHRKYIVMTKHGYDLQMMHKVCGHHFSFKTALQVSIQMVSSMLSNECRLIGCSIFIRWGTAMRIWNSAIFLFLRWQKWTNLLLLCAISVSAKGCHLRKAMLGVKYTLILKCYSSFFATWWKDSCLGSISTTQTSSTTTEDTWLKTPRSSSTSSLPSHLQWFHSTRNWSNPLTPLATETFTRRWRKRFSKCWLSTLMTTSTNTTGFQCSLRFPSWWENRAASLLSRQVAETA